MKRCQTFYVVLFLVVLLCLLVGFVQLVGVVWTLSSADGGGGYWEAGSSRLGSGAGLTRTVVIPAGSPLAGGSQHNCTYHSCFDVYRCGFTSIDGPPQISVYVYPPTRYVDEAGSAHELPMSQEFSAILQAIMDSRFYTLEASSACLLVPSIDLLNQDSVPLRAASRILASLHSWGDGSNHLLFNMLPGVAPDYNTSLDVTRGRAIVAGGGFSTWSYRYTYDVAIPVFNPWTDGLQLPEKRNRPWLVVSSQVGLHRDYMTDLGKAQHRHPSDVLLLHRCSDSRNISERCDGNMNVYQYPHVLQEATFCLVTRGSRLGQVVLSDCLQAGSIPVIVADSFVLPFSEVLDWKRAAVLLDEDDLSSVADILRFYSPAHISSLRHQVKFFWRTYFSSLRAITLTTLQIINDRVFPYTSLKYEHWNDPPASHGVVSPPLLPLIPAKSTGFTAVVLTYDRLESLYKIIHQLALAPSLAKVLVIWNNQLKPPPAASSWPKISKPLKVVQTRHNKLSNRFYPYDEIETEAILALDDDILMLTTDELEFGYEVWREFSDQLVGFPSRLHLWDASTGSWRYESEWTSEISMVLTGAAFYHRYYNYLYTSAMPGNIKSWVDDHMNCEDIAFNFLIANVTGKPPIKVTPRQKFRCPECPNGTVLSADLGGHMVERSECIGKFAAIYGTMPLQTVDFRADPVLFREDVPANHKWFNDVGSL